MERIIMTEQFTQKEKDNSHFDFVLVSDEQTFAIPTGAVARLIIANKEGVVVNQILDVTDNAGGEVRWIPLDVLPSGKYNCEIVVTFKELETNRHMTFPTKGYQTLEVIQNLEALGNGETILPTEYDILVGRIENMEVSVGDIVTHAELNEALQNADFDGYVKQEELEEALKEIDGKSAYEIALDKGFEGDEETWLASLKGETGNSGYTGAANELEVVNDLTTGGATAALSAEQGKVLYESTQTKIYHVFDGYDSSTNTSGYMNSDGVTITANSGCATTDYMDVSGHKTIYITGKTGQLRGMVFGYDSDKNFVKTLLGSNATYTKKEVSIPDNVSYIRVTVQGSLVIHTAEYTSRLDVAESNITTNATNIKTLENNSKNETLVPLLYDTTQNTANAFLASGGASTSTSNGYTTTGFIDVTAYEKIYVTLGMGQINVAVYGYDQNQNPLRGLLAKGTYKKHKLAIPDDITYVRMNSNTTIEILYPTYTDKFEDLKVDINKNAEEIAGIKEESYNKVYNMLDSGVYSNGWLLADGTVKTYNSSAYSVTDFIEVEEGETYYVDATKNAAGITVGGFTAEQTFVSSLLALGTYTKQPITIPAGVKYVRVSSQTTKGAVSALSYEAKISAVDNAIEAIKTDLYTAYKKIPYDESLIEKGFYKTDGTFSTYGGFYSTPIIDVSNYDEVYITTTVTNNGIATYLAYDGNGSVIASKGTSTLEYHPLTIKGTAIKSVRMVGQGVLPSLYFKGIGTGASKKKLNKNVNWVGMSIWWYDGNTLASGGAGIGGGQVCKGYQTLLKEQFEFLSTTDYCYSGNSLGATSADDSNCLMQKKAPNWTASENAIWTLDTITNDCKLGVALGTKDDYDNKTGLLTYYGALREFADKVQELSGNSAIVIASNAVERNNSGLTSETTNSKGHSLADYAVALAYACSVNGWWYVDQFNCGINLKNIYMTTIDGLHLNNLGYRMAVIPWSQVFEIIYNMNV